MICFGEEKYITASKELWKLCFPLDTDEFINFYFSKVYKDEDTLLYFEDDRLVASMQIIPYPIKLGRSISLAGYISGAMTHPDYRNKGIMAKLLNESFVVMKQKEYSHTFLIPQESRLVGFYNKFGYSEAFPENQAYIISKDDTLEYINPFGETIILRDKEVRFCTDIQTLDIADLYISYYRFLNEKENAILKTKPQLDNILYEFFAEGGTLLFNDWGICFALTNETGKVIVKEFFYYDSEIRQEFLIALRNNYPNSEIILMNEPGSPFLRYKGMIKTLDDRQETKNIYMNMMLD
ncbi:GNAT family N-acetyltransferase [Bacteroidales bacterium OttesenSCG-928-I14]|nr:GNAT family N-acetyltransferase [Bacteroidales bacterium OttesenSCG-928-I14]